MSEPTIHECNDVEKIMKWIRDEEKLLADYQTWIAAGKPSGEWWHRSTRAHCIGAIKRYKARLRELGVVEHAEA